MDAGFVKGSSYFLEAKNIRTYAWIITLGRVWNPFEGGLSVARMHFGLNYGGCYFDSNLPLLGEVPADMRRYVVEDTHRCGYISSISPQLGGGEKRDAVVRSRVPGRGVNI